MTEPSALQTALRHALADQARQRATTLGLNRYALAALLYDTRTPTSTQAAEAQRYLDGGRSMLGGVGLRLLTVLGATALDPVWGSSRLQGPGAQRRRSPVTRPAHTLQARLGASAAARLSELGGTQEQLGLQVFGLGPGGVRTAPAARVTRYLSGGVSLLEARGLQLLEVLGLQALTVTWGARPHATRKS